MLHSHKFNADCGVHIYSRKHLGNGKYLQRGVAAGIAPGDQIESFTFKNNTLTVDKIISIKDSSYGSDLLYEAELSDPGFRGGNFQYYPAHNI